MNELTKLRGNIKLTVVLVVYALGLNLLVPRLVGLLGWPIYLDSIGTVAASALGGFIPGIVTAFATNMLGAFFDGISSYYTIINILLAMATFLFLYKGWLRKPRGILLLIPTLAFIGGVLGSLITWYLTGPGDDAVSVSAREWCMTHLGANTFAAHVMVTFALDLIDKAITVLVVVLAVRLLPANTREHTWMNGWKQTPLSSDELKQMQQKKYRGISLNRKLSLMLVLTTLSVAVAMASVSYAIFTSYSDKQQAQLASSTASVAAGVIDPEQVDTYLKEGEDAPGYKQTEKLLEKIRASSPEILYVYVYKIMDDGCHVVFDLDTDGLEGSEPGTLIPFDESFSEYVPALLAGEPIDPIETDDTYGWLLTAYEPVYDADGNCVCYAAADINMHEIVVYQRGFLVRSILIFLGFFTLLFAISLYLAKYHIVLPINSMSSCASTFAEGGEDERSVEEGMAHIRALQIDTGEEIEALYQALCKMCEDLIQRMESMRRQSQTINEMQQGLILVMADMVESRDSNTGQHIHKTAAYTEIIVKGLQRKGYYKDQLTDKFISDVLQSAPLHDVGKINVSDVILNKPGRFTDDEFEIMKSHTTAGRKILEQAMSKVHGESYLAEAINMATYHHEKWDGSGYPTGLAGEDIPLSARIMAIADVFDALASKRVYKDPMPFEKAVSIIKKDAGIHFDPKCAEAFLDSIDEVREVHERLSGTELENL